MKIALKQPRAFLGLYAFLITTLLVHLLLTGATRSGGDPRVLDVARINVRDRDGTLRMVISNRDLMPGIIIGGREFPNPKRQDAGMLFYNDEGTENGGLVFDGRLKDGRPTNGGALSFDRWRQDQTIQMSSIEEGPEREAAFRVFDRPDRPLDLSKAAAIAAMPEGPLRANAMNEAGFGVAQRAYLGRTKDAASELALRDGRGRPRIVLRVESGGASSITFLDDRGQTLRTLSPRS